MHQRQSSHCNRTCLVEGRDSARLWIGIEPIEFLDGVWWTKTAWSRLSYNLGLLSNFKWWWNAIEGHCIYYYTRHSQNPKWIIFITILKEHLTNQFIEHSGDQALFNPVVIMLLTQIWMYSLVLGRFEWHFPIRNLEPTFSDWWLMYLFWNCHQMNVIESQHWFM